MLNTESTPTAPFLLSRNTTADVQHLRSEVLRLSRERFGKSKAYVYIEAACDMAEIVHQGRRRADKSPEVTHPYMVAYIVLMCLPDVTGSSVLLALLHDAVEDNREFASRIPWDYFPLSLRRNVLFLTKPDGWDEDVSPEYHAKFLNASRQVVVVKLADRYHSLLTLKWLPLSKQVRILGETSLVYLKLARQTGFLADELQQAYAAEKARVERMTRDQSVLQE